MDLFSQFSAKENLKKAFQYLKDEVDESTIPLDPIWRPSISAITQLGDEFFEALQDYLRQGKYRPDKADYIFAQKDHLGGRPICIFSVVDRIVFQALLNPWVLGDKIDKKLFSFCLSNRMLGKGNYLRPYKNQWAEFCDKQIEGFGKKFVERVEFDIQTYYENIHIDTLLTVLKEQFKIQDTRLLSVLKRQLKTWAENPTMGLGIPQGANASHVLANAYLYPLDTFINNLKGTGDFEYFRYTDDIVIMAKSVDKVNQIIDKIVLFLRQYNLKLNDKTKLEKLKNTQSIEELKFYNPYGEINETSQQKVAKINKTLPRIFRKIKQGGEVSKRDMSGLKYYLIAGANLGSAEILDDLIAIIPKKPALIYLICRYLGVFISDQDNDFYQTHKKNIHSKYEKVWKTYSKNSLTEWTRFWLLKVLSAPTFAKEHLEFQSEVNHIITDANAKFLRPLVFFYKAYVREQIDPFADLGFSLDDIKRHIHNAKTETEKSIYYYFLIYLQGVEDEGAIVELLYEALQSSSPEIQLMGIFLKQKLGVQLEREITGNLSRIYFKLPLPTEPKVKEEKALAEGDFLTFEGKIAKDQFTQFLGISKSHEKVKYSKVIANKLNFYPESGDAEYKTAVWQFKGKARAFLVTLYKNKNMNFNVDDIKKHCNPLITTQKYQFKGAKDINDTLREVRLRLKANKGEFFPIFKQEKGWIWLEK